VTSKEALEVLKKQNELTKDNRLIQIIEDDLEVLDILSNCFKLICYGIIDFDKNPIFPYPGNDELYDNYVKVSNWIERNNKKVV